MRLGINMLLWADDVRSDRVLPVFEFLRDLGFDGVEIPIFAPDVNAYARLGKALDDLGLARTALTVLGAGQNPMSPDVHVRRAGHDHLKAVSECCQALGAQILAGPNHAPLGVFTGAAPTRDEWNRAVDGARLAAFTAASCGVTLALEPINRFETFLCTTATEMRAFVDAVEHPNCRMMHDTFHAHIEERDPALAIACGGDRLVHVHISENHRGTPGRGQVHWEKTFRALRSQGYDGWLTIEAFGAALPALAAATHIWRPIFDSEEALARDGLAFMRQMLA